MQWFGFATSFSCFFISSLRGWFISIIWQQGLQLALPWYDKPRNNKQSDFMSLIALRLRITRNYLYWILDFDEQKQFYSRVNVWQRMMLAHELQVTSLLDVSGLNEPHFPSISQSLQSLLTLFLCSNNFSKTNQSIWIKQIIEHEIYICILFVCCHFIFVWEFLSSSENRLSIYWCFDLHPFIRSFIHSFAKRIYN